MSERRLRRFYKAATVGEVPGGFAVFLDGKQLKTPAGGPMVLSHRALPEALAAEWEAQVEEIRPPDMPLMRLLSTALDRIAAQPEPVIEEIAGYGATDLVCYRVERPAELARRQQAIWQPLVDWATLRYDAALMVTTGILPQPQPAGALAALRSVVAGHDPLALAGLHGAVVACGSLVLGLALVEGRIDAAGAWEAAQLEENWQIEQWGEDQDARRRRAALQADIEATARYLHLLRA